MSVVGASEFYQLASDLRSAGPALVKPMRAVMQKIGVATAKEWSKNARATSGVHGKHYPRSIDSELRLSFNLEVEVGPNPNKKQGKMGRGFEFGSRNQPPHLDGVKAFESFTPTAEKWLTAAAAGVIDTVAGGGSGPGLREYTTKSGRTRLASEAQIAAWTRGRG